MAKRTVAGRTVKQVTEGNGASGLEIGKGFDHDEAIRIRAIVDTMQEMYGLGGISLGDWWSEIMCNRDDGESGRRLARRLGVPFMLLKYVDHGASETTPVELQEWNEWLASGGRTIVPEYTAEGWEED